MLFVSIFRFLVLKSSINGVFRSRLLQLDENEVVTGYNYFSFDDETIHAPLKKFDIRLNQPASPNATVLNNKVENPSAAHNETDSDSELRRWLPIHLKILKKIFLRIFSIYSTIPIFFLPYRDSNQQFLYLPIMMNII